MEISKVVEDLGNAEGTAVPVSNLEYEFQVG